MDQNGPKKDQKWSKMRFLQIWVYHISLERLCRKNYTKFSFLVPKWPKKGQGFKKVKKFKSFKSSKSFKLFKSFKSFKSLRSLKSFKSFK